MAALALGSLVQSAGAGTASTAAAVWGLAVGVLWITRAHVALELSVRLIGALALIPLLIGFVVDEQCSGIPLFWRLVAAIVIVAVAVVGAIGGVIGGFFVSGHVIAAPIGLVGAVMTVDVLSSPAIDQLLGLRGMGWALAVVAAIAFSLLALRAPTLAATIAVGIVILGAILPFALPGAPCGGGAPHDLPVLAAFVICALAVRMLARAVAR
jgi:hypothetical protein